MTSLEFEDWIVGNLARTLFPTDLSSSNNNTFSEPPASIWSVRGDNYLNDSKKKPSEEAGFALVGINVFRTKEPIFNSACHIKCLSEFLSSKPDSEFFVMDWVLPGPPYHTVVMLFQRRLTPEQDPAFDRVLREFKDGSIEFRKSRFKFLCLVPVAPWALKGAVRSMGGERPVLLCNKLESHHFSGANYVEVAVSVASSKVASMLNSIVIRAGSKVLVDMGFTIECTRSEDLPERILGTSRWHYCAIDAIACTLDSDGSIKSLDVSEPYINTLTTERDVEDQLD